MNRMRYSITSKFLMETGQNMENLKDKVYRYLINLSYMGTKFRGAQKQSCHEFPDAEDPLSIQGQVEIGLKALKPKNPITTVTSSRTDAGVHAFQSTMHVDLVRLNGEPYDPITITVVLNKYFQKHSLPIRILSTFLVPDTFHSRRSAISRTYMYRLVTVKTDSLNTSPVKHHIPIEEYDRAMFLFTNNFDVEKFREATKLFLGLHDFRTFMGKGSKQLDKVTVRSIERLDIEETTSSCYSPYSWPYCMHNSVEDYKFYHITCKASGFLYNQVRRTVGALVAVAQGKVTSRDIKFMLEVPSHNSWDSRIKPVPAHGLYLCEVAYKDCDIQTFKATIEK